MKVIFIIGISEIYFLMKYNQVVIFCLEEDFDKYCYLVICLFSSWKIKINIYKIIFFGFRLFMDVVVQLV